MMQILLDAFEPAFMQRGLLGAALAVLATSMIGTWVVLRGLAFYGDALSHGVVPGIALATLLSFNPIIGALLAAGLMAGMVSLVSTRSVIREDTGIGLLFVGMLSLGIVIVSKTNSFNSQLTALLFGEVLAVSWSDIVFQAVVTAVIVIATIGLRRPLLALTFNNLKAESLGLKPRLTHLAMMILLTLAVVASFQVVGTLLVFGLLIGPPASALLIARRVTTVMLVSILLGLAASVTGLLIGFYAGTATGATIAGLCIAQFFVLLACTEIHKLIGNKGPETSLP